MSPMAIPRRHAAPSAISPTPANFLRDFINRRKTQSAAIRPLGKLVYRDSVHYRSERKYLIHSFVVMPDRACGSIHQRRIRVSRGETVRVQATGMTKGFSEVRIYDSVQLRCVHEYIAQNPVKRRLARSATEYPYSSSCGRFELDDTPQGLKPSNILLPVGTPEGVP